MASPVQYFVVLVVVLGMTHLLCDLLEQAEQLPFWITPRLAALLVTFFVATIWLLRSMAPGPAY